MSGIFHLLSDIKLSPIFIDDDSDGDSACSDETIDQERINFIDVANRPSAVQCEVDPKTMVRDTLANWVINGEMAHLSPLQKAIYDNDFEAFVNIANLYKLLAQPIEFPRDILDVILKKDRVDMLDEFIRRSGEGIDIVKASSEHVGEQDDFQAVNDHNKTYQGLSVHGKKRMDLANRNDPNSDQGGNQTIQPLLWRAAQVNASGIIDYLSGNRPVAAYKFYAASSSDERALRLRRAADLDKVIPGWLGWKITPLGESPLTAAIFGKSLELMKKLFAAQPKLMKASLHERFVFVVIVLEM